MLLPAPCCGEAVFHYERETTFFLFCFPKVDTTRNQWLSCIYNTVPEQFKPKYSNVCSRFYGGLFLDPGIVDYMLAVLTLSLYGRVESVKVLPKRGSEGGVAAFVDFVDIKSAQKAHNSINKMGDRDLRTDYNEPGTIPSAARGLDDSLSIATRGRDVSGFTRGAGGPVYGPPVSLHSREGRFERRLDGAADGRERTYDHSTYGHHERSSSNSSGFDRQRHYETDYYRDSRDRALSGASGSASSASGSIGSGSSGASVGVAGSVAGSTGAGGSNSSTAGVGSGGSTPGGIVYYGSRSRSPSRFETTETRYEPRAREAFTIASVVHRDLYREERGRRGERTYHHSRSRSPHSSHSHNPSPQRLPSQAARPARSHSGSGSHSRSSSSDSVSSTSSSGSGSSDSSSSSSDQSPARSVQSAAVPAPSAQPLPSLDKDEPRKSFGIKVQNLPVRSTDTSLKDGLFHEFKKHGKVTSVQIHGASEERYGLVFFRQQEDQEKALSASKGKLFFGMQIDVTAWHGPETESENEFRPLDERIDEFHPKATRTLFIGNLEKTTTYHDLLNIFQRFGEIVDIDIKKVNGSPQYAFLQYCDIASVCKAIKKMDGEYLGNNRLKLGFGKSMPTTCVWLDGLSSSITEQYLTRHFCRYGHVVKVVFDRLKGMALILYNNIEYAQAAVKETKGWKIGGNKIKVDFANQESQMAFYRSMQASGQDIRDFYEITNERRDERRPPYHEFTAERAYYENVRAPGSYTEDPRRKYPARSREFYSEWDPYQGDYYDPRYYDDPREYRDYRDPYEQDIRKYSYLQRERERERERFETDRERDHSRRTVEHNQSPSHPRRPVSPAASPSHSERPPSDSEHHVYSRSSERSGSCSSLSPPRFEKPDKIRLERHNRSDKSEKDKSLFEAERGNGGEKDRRAGRKEKGDKDRTEKQKLRKLKLASPTVPSLEPDLELDRETSPEASLTLRGKSSKSLFKDKDYSGKGKLDLLPCVVQLTRVKEKEVKLIDSILSEKQKTKVGSDPVRSPTSPPSADHKGMHFRIDTQARDFFKHGKHLKEKGLASQVEVLDKEGNVKNKKYSKTDLAYDTSSSVDADRLAARKRRFKETCGKADHVKKITQEEDEVKLRRIIDEPLLKDFDYDVKMQRKEVYKREKIKPERMVTVSTTEEELETVLSVGPSLDLQARLREPTEEATDPLDSLDQKTQGTIEAHSQPSFSLEVSDDGSVDMEFSKDQEQQHITSYHIHSSRIERDSESKERLLSDIDHSQSCRKQMEQNRRLQQQLLEYDKSDKTESTPSTDAEDFEHRSLVHEVGKPPQDVTSNSPPSKRKKSGPFEFDFGTKRERDYQRFKHINDEPERRLDSLPGTPFAEDASQLLEKEPDSPVAMSKNCLQFDVSKYNIGNTVCQGLSLHAEILKVKTSVTEEELCWESKIRQGTFRGEMSFPTSIVKRESIRKRPERELEPGEVQSDSDEDIESRHLSLKPDSFNREHEERLSDVTSSESLEKNKFYEFALDKTITPDTKALLERAKSLSSSREENWSFLGHDSKFKSFRNSTDKEKSEPTPRPIPSWYMKKKKIRSYSEGKLDDKKEDAKHIEQERQELFASRFLHSSIFEQDSRRLQHLEQKNNDPEVKISRDHITSNSQEEQAGPGGSDLSQEPRVLFHSRFLELQQKDKNQQLRVSERICVTEEEEEEEEQTLDEEFEPSPNISEISQELTVNHIPATTSPTSLSKVSEISVQHDKPDLSSTFTNKDGPEVVNEQSEDAPEHSPPSVSLKEQNIAAPVSSTSTGLKEDVTVKEPNEKLSESIMTVNPSVEQNIDVKPPTPGASLSNIVPECDPFQATSPLFSNPSQTQEITELPETKSENVNASLHKIASPLDVELPETEPELEPEQPPRKQPRNKKVKPVSPTPIPQVSNEKPATRKSERIDREKLKRSSSPRGDSLKLIADPKNSTKSPVHATDSEQGLESNTNHGKTRQRRNVRSVYATPHEDEAPQQPGKEITEPSRSTRKRCTDKEAATQQMATTLGRRGRPPKTRKRDDDMSLVKGDQTKNSESEDTEIKESTTSGEISKTADTWRSPRSQKGQSSPIRAGQSRKTLKLDKVSGSPEPVQSDSAAVDASPALDHQNESKDETLMQVGQLSHNTKQHNISKREKEIAHPAEEKLTDIEITSVEKTQALDQKKVKASRSTRNTKIIPDDNSVNVVNLTLDTVKDALHSGDNKAVSSEGSLKTKTAVLVKEDLNVPIYHKEEDIHGLEEIEPPTDPVAAFLAHQMELERAVENISRLTDEQHPAPYKEPRAEPATLTPAVIVQPADETEVEKPANPASETELAAAIDSITAEDISGEADGFSTPTTFTALLPTPEALVLPVSSEGIEPETDLTVKTIVESEQDSVMIPDSKPSQTSNTDTSLTESPLSEAAKKGGRARPKTPKKSRGRKACLNRKLEINDDAVLEPESTIVKLPESIPEEIQTANPKAATSAAAAAVVTVAAACKHEATVTLDTPKEAEQPAVDQPEPQESAFHSGNNSPSYSRTQQPSPEPEAPAHISPTTCLNSPESSKTPLTHPEWNTRTEEKGIPPKPQVSMAFSTPGVAGPPANPPMPPDTKASDIDPSSSTLRKILMEPKYVSASNSNAAPSMQFTTTTADARISENENSVEAVLPLKTSLLEDRPSPITQLVPRTAPPQPQPLLQCESPQILKEKLGITSTATSVISRIPMPFDSEDTPRISLSNRSSGMSLPKQKYRTSLNDNSRYHGLNPSDNGGSVGRPVVESTHCNTGSSAGLRVNTSEGVVVLSYSGQKTEGPQRIIAKISQIPPASAVDIEFQQPVTKSQIKQEPPPHPSTPKGSQTPTGYGHAGVVLAGQAFSAQPVISSINQESPSFEKSEPSYHTGQQGGSVKTFQQSTSHSQLLRYSLSIAQQQHIKKNGAAETVSIKTDIKPSQTFNIKPVLSPHHPSLAVNHILTPSAQHERVVSQPKHDSHSPRASGHSTSPFSKVCPPSSSVVLGPSRPISQFVSNIHHAEQSVIMPPHSVTQSVPIGNLSQGDVRASTPLSGIGYGIHSENLLSPRSAPPQRSTTPQPAVIRDVVLKSHASSCGDGQVVGTSNDDMQSLPQGLRRASAPQLQQESIVMQADFKGLHHRALRLDQYARDVRLLVHQHLTDHPSVVESRQTRTPETMQSSSHISSAPSKTSPVVKNTPQTVRDASKSMDLKMPLSPHSDNRIIGHPPGSVMVSPQGVQLIHPGNANSMSEYYREMRGFHPQYPGHSVIGINLANRGIVSSQVSQIDHCQRHKVPSVSSIESVGSFGESKLDGSHIRHPSSMDLCQISRVQGETGSPSYTSPVTITPKLEMPITVQKGPQGPISSQMPPPSSVSSQMRSDFKLDHTGLRSVDMVQLLTKYPIIWQGHLALKNDTAAVQLHFVSGNNVLAHRSLPSPEGGAFLRIAQRMRLEASQLEGVARRMTAENEYCLLLALPCGLDQEDVHNQTHALKTGFITYLQAKQAAGIINVPNPGSNQPAYVVQIFPPCEFSESHLSHLAPDLLNSISSISPHLMIVIASV
ncbi:msx2-interacting protein isoform X1 [Carassius gibelio]|uniref:msx2-interacting protein isoform X1 n=3 Tax=Carassius gibelio TaxID=101364 RepID=UPI0022792A01|nr:msx2-interacting protein isoform X1 [Carassius gibelio]